MAFLRKDKKKEKESVSNEEVNKEIILEEETTKETIEANEDSVKVKKKSFKSNNRKKLFGNSKNARKIGIDLGTANTIFYSDGSVILREPSVVAIHKPTGKVLAAGEEAKKMIGRTPGNIIAINPLKNGVIADFDVTCLMIECFLKQVYGDKKLYRYDISICAPYGITEVEKRAIQESLLGLGVKNVTLIEEPLAAAIGANLNVSEPIGSMVVDIGGGTTETAVISLGGIVNGVSTRVGGDKLDEAIIAHVKKNYDLIIAEKTAEQIKISIGTVDENYNAEMVIRGRDLLTGLPASRLVKSSDVCEAISSSIDEMIQDIKATLEQAPPELAADIICNGIVLTGGGALLNGLPKLIERETLVPVRIAENPLDCVALGTGMSIE